MRNLPGYSQDPCLPTAHRILQRHELVVHVPAPGVYVLRRAMNMTNEQLWQRFQEYYAEFPSIDLAIDISRMRFSDSFWQSMKKPMAKAFRAMEKLEGGAVANPDEKRMVGHYWLRDPKLAPTKAIQAEIRRAVSAVKRFSGETHSGKVKGAKGAFKYLLVIGIGGSALGPQFVSKALGDPRKDRMKVFFFDNTDPDGMDAVLAQLRGRLGQTLCVVISKSGGTKETRNGMLEAKAAYETAGLVFERHAVAVTGDGSNLDKIATSGKWLKRFPMWDWVGGRTSELSAVGLLPAALQGLDIDAMLKGAAACDNVTRTQTVEGNPAAQLALMWHYAGGGRGTKDMVILPYKDRLELFSKYLQQLIMESLGKELDLEGRVVNQGIAVYGNKGSTDQHAYVQQLREGVNNFFVTFIEVLTDREGKSMQVEENQDVTTGDYLNGFFQGTRKALFDNNRDSITLTISKVSPFSVGMLIALYERAVGLYAFLVGVNAYHQPGVEAGKVAATSVVDLQIQIQRFLASNANVGFTAEEIAKALGRDEDSESVFKVCQHLASNAGHTITKQQGKKPVDAKFTKVSQTRS